MPHGNASKMDCPNCLLDGLHIRLGQIGSINFRPVWQCVKCKLNVVGGK